MSKIEVLLPIKGEAPLPKTWEEISHSSLGPIVSHVNESVFIEKGDLEGLTPKGLDSLFGGKGKSRIRFVLGERPTRTDPQIHIHPKDVLSGEKEKVGVYNYTNLVDLKKILPEANDNVALMGVYAERISLITDTGEFFSQGGVADALETSASFLLGYILSVKTVRIVQVNVKLSLIDDAAYALRPKTLEAFNGQFDTRSTYEEVTDLLSKGWKGQFVIKIVKLKLRGGTWVNVSENQDPSTPLYKLIRERGGRKEFYTNKFPLEMKFAIVGIVDESPSKVEPASSLPQTRNPAKRPEASAALGQETRSPLSPYGNRKGKPASSRCLEYPSAPTANRCQPKTTLPFPVTEKGEESPTGKRKRGDSDVGNDQPGKQAKSSAARCETRNRLVRLSGGELPGSARPEEPETQVSPGKRLPVEEEKKKKRVSRANPKSKKKRSPADEGLGSGGAPSPKKARGRAPSKKMPAKVNREPDEVLESGSAEDVIQGDFDAADWGFGIQEFPVSPISVHYSSPFLRDGANPARYSDDDDPGSDWMYL
jgi:hypothetical protein